MNSKNNGATDVAAPTAPNTEPLSTSTLPPKKPAVKVCMIPQCQHPAQAGGIHCEQHQPALFCAPSRDQCSADDSSFPSELTSKKNWLCWELTVTDAGLKKMPRNPITGGPASCDNPNTWVDFETARQAVKEGRYDSIGIALTKGLGLAIVDFDKVREPHEPMPQWVRSQIADLDSYTEISASGTGAHVLVWSSEDLPNINRQEQHCEIHFKNKMFALSGDVFEGRNVIRKRSLAVLHKRVLDGELYKPLIANVDSQKFLDICACRYEKYGFGRSEAVQSALVYLAGKHNCDMEAMAEAFERTELCADWGEKWQRLRDKELEHAVEFYQKNLACRSYHMTEAGNGARLVAAHGDSFRYVHDRSKWCAWDGRRWALDQEGAVYRAYKEVVKGMWEEAIRIDDDDLRKKALNWCRRSEFSHVTAGSLVQAARFESAVSALACHFDTQPMLFNLENGTLDLETLALRSHDRHDMLTKLAPIQYDLNARCPRWEQFLAEVLPDKDVREFVQRSLGYTLTGGVEAQCFWLLIGPGANGKSTMLETLRTILGDYSVATKFDVFAQHHKQGTAISPRDGLATLEGARFVCASESDQERRISAAMLKSITGGERLRAARMYEQDRAFDVTFKIWLSTNHEPCITDTSEGMWRRVQRVNFDVIIPPEKRDPQLVPKLIAEASGILNWCLEGLRQYRAGGLQVPDAVSKATAEYRSSQDLVEQFLAERCDIDRKRFTPVDELYHEFRMWAQDAGNRPMNAAWFGRELAKRFKSDRRNNRRGFMGPYLRPEPLDLGTEKLVATR